MTGGARPASGTAIVTGAAGGIGLAVATALANEGVRVVAADVKDPAPSLTGLEHVRCVQLDLLDPGAPDQLLAQVGGDGALDYLVNAAGVAWFDRDGSVTTVAEDVWSRVMRINLDVMRCLTVAALPALRRGQGKSIVHIASIAGLRGMDSPLDAYQVSKAAVVSLSRSLAIQLGPEGIRSNTVCPGAILTPMIAPLYAESPGRCTDMAQRTPLRRLGLPEDIANAVLFLLSEKSSFVTGVDLVVDGGWTAQIK